MTFPDVPGCVSAGSDLEEAFAMGAEALGAHLAWLAEDGDPIPEPIPEPTHDPEALLAEAVEVEGGKCFLAPFAVTVPGRVRPYNVSLDESLVEEIDAVAPNRSGFLAAAAREYLRRHRDKAA